MNNILSIVNNIHGEAINAGQVALLCIIGFVLVIAVLVMLILLLTGFSKVFGKLENVSFKKKPATQAAQSVSSDSAEDEETVAAITAALLAFYDVSASDSEEAVPPPFVIRSIKKN